MKKTKVTKKKIKKVIKTKLDNKVLKEKLFEFNNIDLNNLKKYSLKGKIDE